MTRQKILLSIAIVGLAIGAVRIGMLLFGDPKPADEALGFYTALGYGAAEEAAAIVGDGAAVVLVLPGSGSPEMKAFAKSAESGFSEAAEKHGLKVRGREPAPGGGAAVLDRSFFLRLIEDHPDVLAVVSLAGPPNLNPEDVTPLGDRKLIAYVMDSAGLDQRFEGGLIHRAILARYGKPAESGDSPRQLFDRYFEVVDSSTLSAQEGAL